MRVTNSMVIDTTLGDLNRALSKLQTAQGDLTTGKLIRRSSDDPTRASAAMTIRNQLRQADVHDRSLSDAEAWLSAADTALVSGLEMLGLAKEAAVRAGNDGVASPQSRDAIARSIENIRAELLTLANTKYLDRSIFNGTAAGDAYNDAGNYLGNYADVVRTVGPSSTVTVNLTGDQIFGAQGTPQGNVFDVLERLADAARAGDLNGITAAHNDLTEATERWSSATAEIGSRGARVAGIRDRAAQTKIILGESLSKLEDTDIAEALIRVKANENAYNAALAAAAQVLPPSLLDYMR